MSKIKNTYTDSPNGDSQYSSIAGNQINLNATTGTPVTNGLRVISFIVLLSLFSTATTVKADLVDSAVTSFWTSVAKSAGGDVEGVVAGFALSALGLSGASQEDADLTAIINLLTEIDAEITVLVNEVQQLQCLTSQDQTTLTDSIKHIQGLYDTYYDWVDGAPTVPCWEESDVDGNICFGQTGIKTWLNEVIDPENGVDADLDAINDVMIQAGNTGVIYTCVKTITTNYNSSDDPTKFVFDWSGDTANPGYYDQVQSLTNYYYGVQAQGTALLSEASHLQACLSLGSSECQFTGQGSDNSDESVNLNATPSNPGDICANAEAGSVAAEDCTDAQNSVVKIYGYIKAQLLVAGAPYTTALVGKVMAQASLSKADLIYPKSLEDFTNNATANGEKIQKSPCDVPLTSADSCGFTVGGYNHTAPSGTTYGEVSDANGKVVFEGYDVWKFGNVSFEGDNLTTLLANYTGKTAGDTEGTLGNWMASVGFINNSDSSKGALGNPGLKIVLTGEVHNAAGNNKAACFMDTNITRSDSGQPWCDDNNGTNTSELRQKSGSTYSCSIEGVNVRCQNYIEANFTKSSTAPDFYALKMIKFLSNSAQYSWTTSPGWFESQQSNKEFHHFHWPSLELQNLPSDWCTIRNKGTQPANARNSGDVPSMCGKDLEAWLDNELPPPVTSTISQSLNSTVFETGDMLSMGIAVNNTTSSTNYYVGGILPDGNTMFFLISLNPLLLTEGFLDDPGSFRPLSELAEVVPVGEKAYLPGLFTYTFSGHESIGDYYIFSFLSAQDVFADGSIDKEDIIMLDFDIFTFSGDKCCD